MKERLNQRTIDRMKDKGRYCDGGNLYLNVSEAGTKSWLFISTRGGIARSRGLGSLRDVTLAEAREKAAEYRKQLRQGVEPPKYRTLFKKPDQGRKFSEVAERYIAAHRDGWKNAKNEGQWRSSLTAYAYPFMGDLDVADITVSHVHQALEPIWGKKTDTAKKVRGRIGAVLGFAAGLDLRDDIDLTRPGGKLDYLLPKASRVHQKKGHDSLDYTTLPQFMQELRSRPGVSSAALDFVILTASRTGEVLEAKWSEFDMDAATWTVPADRMKAGREHRVPLSPDAVAILKSLPRDKDDGFVFISATRAGEPMSNMAMTALLKRMGRKEGVTVHGFRSTFRTWAAEKCLDIPREIAESALAHSVGGVEGAYQRGNYFNTRREMMDRFAAYCRGETT